MCETILVQEVKEFFIKEPHHLHTQLQHYNSILMTFLNDGKECIEFVGI